MIRHYLVLFGSNVDARENLENVQRLMRLNNQIRLESVSGVYESPAVLESGLVDYERRPFTNSAFLIATQADYDELRSILRGIEAQLGRVRTADKYADRTVDLDVLAARYGDIFAEFDPEVWAYAYAVLPAAEIAPEWNVGEGRTPLSQLATRCNNQNGEVRKIL